jgi:ArsR family transcriptional regulator
MAESDTIATLTADPAVDDDSLAAMAKALGHPIRVRIMRLLAERCTCATGELVTQLPLAQSTISEHLRILREAKCGQSGPVDAVRRTASTGPDWPHFASR